MRGSSPHMTIRTSRSITMTIHLSSQSDLEDAVHALLKQDVRLKPILELTGMPALRQREPGFAGLAAIVCGQQLSTASAAAIWSRLAAAFDPFDHDVIRKARADRLGRLGLSAAKIKTLKHIARELAAERLTSRCWRRRALTPPTTPRPPWPASARGLPT